MAQDGNLKYSKPVGNAGGQHKRSFLTKETVEIRKQGHIHIVEKLDMYGNLTLEQLQDFATKEKHQLSVKDAMCLKLWEKTLGGSQQHMKLVLGIYGIATEIKALQITDLENAYKSNETEQIKDISPIPLNSKERIEMLEKMIEIEKKRAQRK